MAIADDGRNGREEWQAMAPRWERGRHLLWGSTRAVSEWLVDRLDPRPGQTILELAAGTGDTGFLAAPRLVPGGQLITSDVTPGMLEGARRLAKRLGIANVDFRLLDAERIDLDDASVDGVLCRWGYTLRGDPPPALREIRRVLRPGGRLAFSVWAERERNRWMTVPSSVMVERGHLRPPSSKERRLSEKRNEGSIRRLLAEAGFGEPELEEMPVTYRFADADELWFFVSELRGPVALALGGLDEDERADVRAAIEEQAAAADGTSYELPGVSINVIVS